MIHHLPAADRHPRPGKCSGCFNPVAAWSSPNSRPRPGRIRRHLTQHILGHAMASNDLDAIRDLAAAAGGTDLNRHPTVLQWLDSSAHDDPVSRPIGASLEGVEKVLTDPRGHPAKASS